MKFTVKNFMQNISSWGTVQNRLHHRSHQAAVPLPSCCWAARSHHGHSAENTKTKPALGVNRKPTESKVTIFYFCKSGGCLHQNNPAPEWEGKEGKMEAQSPSIPEDIQLIRTWRKPTDGSRTDVSPSHIAWVENNFSPFPNCRTKDDPMTSSGSGLETK